MDKTANKELTDTAALLFSMLSPREQDCIISLLKSLLSELQSSSAVPPSVEKTKQ